MSDTHSKFDFNAWKELAQHDPQAYFQARERAILEFIERHPGQEAQLLRLQSQIDTMRAIAGSPQYALRQLSSMLEDHLQALDSRLRMLHDHLEEVTQNLGQRE